MKIYFTYPKDSDGQIKKLIKCYYSWDSMMPNQATNDGSETNPDKLQFESTLKDNKTGLEKFEQPNLYMMFEPVFDCILKINVHFKEGIKKSLKPHDNENFSFK